MEGNTTVTLYSNIFDVPIVVRAARLESAGSVSCKLLQRTLHKHRFQNFLDEYLVVRRLEIINKDMNSEAYTHTLETTDEITKSLGDMVTHGNYSWDSRTLLPISSKTPRPSLARNSLPISKVCPAVYPGFTSIVFPVPSRTSW